MITGLSLPSLSGNADVAIQKACADGYDFVTTTLPTFGDDDSDDTLVSSVTDNFLDSSENDAIMDDGNVNSPSIRTDVTTLESRWWSTSVVGMVGGFDSANGSSSSIESEGDREEKSKLDHISLLTGYRGISEESLMSTVSITNSNERPNNGGGNGDGGGRNKRKRLYQKLDKMVEWACHMNIPAIILPEVPCDGVNEAANMSETLDYARALSSVVPKCAASNVHLWIRVPFRDKALQSFQFLHAKCDYAMNLGCMLVIQDQWMDYYAPSSTLGPSSKTETTAGTYINKPSNNSSSSSNSSNSIVAAAANLIESSSPSTHNTNNPQILQQVESEATKMASNFALLHRFVGCNCRAICINTKVFLTNKRGFPTLSRSYQSLFKTLLQRLGRTLRVLVEGQPYHHTQQMDGLPMKVEMDDTESVAGKSGCLTYLQYLKYLRMREDVTSVLDTEESKMETSYLDTLQSALQPLGDNLEFQIYETFERDPVKYKMYQVAIELALRDGLRLKLFRPHKNTIQVTIFVVGAGRGPLVRMALAAIANINATLSSEQGKQSNDKISPNLLNPKIFAIEKNPSAVLYLKSLCVSDELWRDSVKVIESDMRYLTSSANLKKYPILAETMEQKSRLGADIVVSELLGSFGDNELSPECLDGMQRSGLMKKTCVSIPQSYLSYIAPVSSMRLYTEACSQSYSPHNPMEGPSGKPAGTLQALETPYVVRTHAASQTHVEKLCWEFTHPVVHKENSRFSRMENADSDDGSIEGKVKRGIEAMGLDSIQSLECNSNERHAQLTFSPEIMDGSRFGCGYGPVNNKMEEIMNNFLRNASTRNPQKLVASFRSNTIHGFLGTFHCTLYQSRLEERVSANISIAPHSFSKGMFSWFPLYFPLREPLNVPAGASINCNIWRKTDVNPSESHGGGAGGKVWYEWCADVCHMDGPNNISVLSSSPVHNPNGRSSHVRL